MRKLNSRQNSGPYLQTGAFAELAGVNRRTLHYYDQIGLFSPDHTGENGYRYYSIYQLDRLALIVALRDLGVSLRDIQTCLASGDVGQMNRLLEEQDAEIARSIAQLERRRTLLRDTLADNRRFVRYLDRGYQLLDWPEVRWELIWDMDPDLGGGARVVNYLTDGPGTGMRLQDGRHQMYQKRENGSHVTLAGPWFCCWRRIPYGPGHETQICQMDAAAAELQQAAAERGLALEDSVYLEFNDNIAMGEPGQVQYLQLRARVL